MGDNYSKCVWWCRLKSGKKLLEPRGQLLMEDGRIVRSLVKNIKVGDYLICQQGFGY